MTSGISTRTGHLKLKQPYGLWAHAAPPVTTIRVYPDGMHQLSNEPTVRYWKEQEHSWTKQVYQHSSGPSQCNTTASWKILPSTMVTSQHMKRSMKRNPLQNGEDELETTYLSEHKLSTRHRHSIQPNGQRSTRHKTEQS